MTVPIIPINKPDKITREAESKNVNESLVAARRKLNESLKMEEKRIEGSELSEKTDTDININNNGRLIYIERFSKKGYL